MTDLVYYFCSTSSVVLTEAVVVVADNASEEMAPQSGPLRRGKNSYSGEFCFIFLLSLANPSRCIISSSIEIDRWHCNHDDCREHMRAINVILADSRVRLYFSSVFCPLFHISITNLSTIVFYFISLAVLTVAFVNNEVEKICTTDADLMPRAALHN